jgi:hypothetical protein
MAATTITRTGVTLTNDTGSAASPNGDGTLLNNAWVQVFLDRIDSLISGDITFGGKVVGDVGEVGGEVDAVDQFIGHGGLAVLVKALGYISKWIQV